MRALLKNAILSASVAASSNAVAFRTAGDLEQFSGTQRVRWAEAEIHYELNGDLPPDVAEEEMATATHSALEVWSQPGCSGVSFVSEGFTDTAAAPNDGRSTIQFIQEEWESFGYAATAAGATDLQYERVGGQWQLVEADIYINAEYFHWTTNAVAATDERTVFSVLLHESGHMLGLLHPCEEDPEEHEAPLCDRAGITAASSVMYPYYSATQRSLTGDDEAGVCFLYPRCELDGCPQGSVCAPGGCIPACEAADAGFCDADEVCTTRGCVPLADCRRTDCSETLICHNDADCSLGYHCGEQEHTCVTGTGAIGDPCTNDEDCHLGGCSEGVCLRACASSSDCESLGDSECVDQPSNGVCSGDGGCDEGGVTTPTASGWGVCSAAGRGLGERCAESDECLGGQCLAGAAEQPVCSRLCGEDEQPCPGGWSCELVEDRSVCVLEPSDSGCAIVGAAPSPDTGTHLSKLIGALCAPTLLFALRRRRRRQRSTVQSLHQPN